MLHRFSKRCRPFNQNGTERNDKNYGKKTTVPRAFYWTEFGTFFWRLLYFNQSLSLWEPLLEIVEKKSGRYEQWDVQLMVRRHQSVSQAGKHYHVVNGKGSSVKQYHVVNGKGSSVKQYHVVTGKGSSVKQYHVVNGKGSSVKQYNVVNGKGVVSEAL